MFKKASLFLLLILCLCLQACASKLMTEDPNPAKATLDQNTAYITFFRPSSLGAAIQAPVVEYDQKNDHIKLIGILSYKYKVRYKVAPGEHFFAVGGESASPLKAKVEAGKAYYNSGGFATTHSPCRKVLVELWPVTIGR